MSKCYTCREYLPCKCDEVDNILSEHKMVTKLIEKYREDFKDFGTLKVRKVKTKGRPVVEFWLNKEQALLLGTYMRNSDIVRGFKKRLIHEFKSLKDKLISLNIHKQQPEYQITRDVGKIVRKQTTDMMKQFVEYAGSQVARMQPDITAIYQEC